MASIWYGFAKRVQDRYTVGFGVGEFRSARRTHSMPAYVIQGFVPAVVTPFADHGDIMFDAFEEIIRWHLGWGRHRSARPPATTANSGLFRRMN